MYFFPYKSISLKTNLSPDQCIENLKNEVGMVEFLRIVPDQSKKFEGKIENNNFTIRLSTFSILVRGSPEIFGKIIEKDGETDISLTFTVYRGTIVAFPLSYFLLLLSLFFGGLANINFTKDFMSLWFLFLCISLHIYVLFFWNKGFSIALNKLVTIFHADTVSK